MDISRLGVFVFEVLTESLPVLLAIVLRVFIEIEVDGALEDAFWVELSVGFCHYSSVDGARGVGC